MVCTSQDVRQAFIWHNVCVRQYTDHGGGDLRRRRISGQPCALGIFCLTLRTNPMKSKTYIAALAALAAVLIITGCAGHDYREDRRDTRQDTRQDIRHERQDARW